MRTRLHKKRRRLSEEDFLFSLKNEEPIHRRKRSRRLSSHTNLKIILRKLNPDRFRARHCEDKKYENAVTEPRCFLTRIDAKTFAKLSNLMENACSPDNDSKGKISRREDTKRFEFTKIEKTSVTNGFPGYETITTSNILSVHTESLYIPNANSDTKDAVDSENMRNRRGNVPSEVAKRRVLKDMRNVSRIDIPSRLSSEGKSVALPRAPGTENVQFKETSQRRQKQQRVDHYEETPARKLLKRGNRFSKLVVSLKRMDTEFLEEEFLETSSKTEKRVEDKFTEIQKNVKIQKTRGIAVRSCESGIHQNKTEIIQELHVEKVKNVSLLKLRNCDDGSIFKSLKKKIVRRISSLSNSENQTDGEAENTTSYHEDSESRCSVPVKLKQNTEKKRPNVSFREKPDFIDRLSTRTRFVSNRRTSKKHPIMSTPSIYEGKFLLTPRIKLSDAGVNLVRYDKETKKAMVPCSSTSLTPRVELRNVEKPFQRFIEDHQVPGPSNISRHTEKRKLNVSFKEEADIIEDDPFKSESSSRKKIICEKDVITSTPYSADESMRQNKLVNITQHGFAGFPESVDLSSHKDFCSHVLSSVKSTLPTKNKKLMNRREAAKRREIANLCKKALENLQRPVKTSQRIALKQMKARLEAQAITEAEKKECLDNSRKPLTPCVRLTKLSEADISSYKITPLREERLPIPPKTEFDYGIDDISTDDSTDDEDCPKKILPEWAKEVKENLKNSFNPQEVLPRALVQRWIKCPKIYVPIKRYLFSKRK